MNNIRPFQIVLIAIFAFFALAALIFLSEFQSERTQEEFAYGKKVTIWGTLSQDVFTRMFQDITREDKPFNVVEYRQINEEDFDSELVNGIAEGRSPDLVVLKSDALVTHRVKLLPVPYSTLSLRDFKDAYVDAAEIFTLEDGVYGIPFAVDPLIMYWNRDMLASNGIAQPPRSWESIVTDIVPRLTIRDTSRNVTQSGIAFGEYRNVHNAKNILMLLLLQTGSKMVTQKDTQYKVSLNDPIVEGARAPLESVLQFYTDFSNVNSPLYTWNRAMPEDKDAFLGGDLGVYFGLGSEYTDIAQKNPNLNFDVAVVPQGVGATALRTYGDVYAFAIPRASKNVQGSYAVARVLSNAQNAQHLVTSLDMAPVLRKLIAKGDENLYREIILQSALIARSWFDPGQKESDSVFMQMIEDVVSNRARIGDAVGDAIDRLTLVY